MSEQNQTTEAPAMQPEPFAVGMPRGPSCHHPEHPLTAARRKATVQAPNPPRPAADLGARTFWGKR